MAAAPLLDILIKAKAIKAPATPDAHLDLVEKIGMGIAFLGLAFQLNYGFAVPFPLSLLLLPFTIIPSILETILTWMVAFL